MLITEFIDKIQCLFYFLRYYYSLGYRFVTIDDNFCIEIWKVEPYFFADNSNDFMYLGDFDNLPFFNVLNKGVTNISDFLFQDYSGNGY